MLQGALLSRPVFSKHGIFFWFLRSLVKVRYSFFFVSAILSLQARSLTSVATWIVVVFASILLHECGHALAARYYGQMPQIELHGMGGVTKWAWVDELKWRKRVLISVAGPAAGFVLGLLAWAVGFLLPVDAPYVVHLARHQFLWASVAWGLFNLLPLLPMDGGQALTEYLEHRRGRTEGRLLGRKVSIATGALGFATAIFVGQTWAAFLCAIFAFDNYQRMRGLAGININA